MLKRATHLVWLWALVGLACQPKPIATRTEAAWFPILQSLHYAIEQNNATAFRQLWTPEGYAQNLTGKYGLSGEKFFQQTQLKQWYPEPEILNVSMVSPHMMIVPCQVMRFNKTRADEAVWLLIIQENGKWFAHGFASEKDAIRQLAQQTQSAVNTMANR